MPVRPQKRARGSECSGARLLSKNPRKQQHIIYQKANAHTKEQILKARAGFLQFSWKSTWEFSFQNSAVFNTFC